MLKFIPKPIKKVLKPVYYLTTYRFDDWKRKTYYQYFPAKPEVINLNANDICNSKCTMCNIWQQKQDFELSPQDLKQIFQDQLFAKVKHIGITGGEPTLREDLPQLYEVACQTISGLKGLSIITNAIRTDDVIQRVSEVQKVCNKYQIGFSMMVSLDGYGQTHERVRGRDGNFESALKVINHFKNNTDIPVAIGCTISKENVWDVDELLSFLKQEGIYGRFRVAEYIKRLYNEDREEVIRNFDEEELYHLQCFFKKVELTFEESPTYQRTYRNIIGMLGGKPRAIACPYQAKGIVLDSRGGIHYCAPKSGKIGNALKTSAKSLFKKELKERRRLIKESCSDCIHDYHAPITYKEQLKTYQDIFWLELYTINHINRAKLLKPFITLSKGLASKKTKVYIVGWYGTETVGDKAILGGILEHYIHLYQDNVEFYVASIYPFVTVKTMKELGYPQVKVIPCNSFDFAKYAAKCDEVVMGGGPLMDMESLAIPLWAFKVAKLFNKKTTVFGCGLGPLHLDKYINAVKLILKLSDEIKLRDSKSVEYAKKNLGINRDDITNAGDSAFNYISGLKKKLPSVAKKNTLACFLRDWTKEYQGNLTDEDFFKLKEKFESKIAEVIKVICKEYDITPAFYPMHSFVVGNDDRDFYREFTAKYFQNETYYIYKQNANIETTVKAMQSSRLNLCMRFHSVLFAHTLETNYLAIDYTNGGKITGFLTDNNELHRMMGLQKIATLSIDELKSWFLQV